MTVSERRASYSLQQRIKVYDPDSMARLLNQGKTQGKMIVNGINILNKSSLDTDIIMDRIKHRRETHNRVERRRRDMLNMLINELAQSIPETATMEPERCHRALVLRQAISYIRTIQSENNALRAQLGHPTSSDSNASLCTTASSSSSSSNIFNNNDSGYQT
ncbi:hypothetical protein VTP01DRAFT_3394 [Rhizomucor pusillus]|uniref:uncharacterized protein n=1 Tax=Rhizomucor pusillus TaxID=4840 RepID=UPI003742B9A8